jgi:hypothetical protein
LRLEALEALGRTLRCRMLELGISCRLEPSPRLCTGCGKWLRCEESRLGNWFRNTVCHLGCSRCATADHRRRIIPARPAADCRSPARSSVVRSVNVKGGGRKGRVGCRLSRGWVVEARLLRGRVRCEHVRSRLGWLCIGLSKVLAGLWLHVVVRHVRATTSSYGGVNCPVPAQQRVGRSGCRGSRGLVSRWLRWEGLNGFHWRSHKRGCLARLAWVEACILRL